MFFKIRAALTRRKAQKQRERLVNHQVPWPDHFDHICVVGMPRTGTTFIQTALGRSAVVMTFGEHPLLEVKPKTNKPTGVKTIIPDLKAAKQYILDIKKLSQKKSILIVYCYRTNLLHQYISLQRAMLTNQWHSMENTEIKKIESHTIDTKQFYWFLKNAYSIQAELQNIISMTSSYDILFENNHEQLQALLKKLNQPTVDIHSLSTQKLKYDPRKWAKNYRELEAMYQQTILK